MLTFQDSVETLADYLGAGLADNVLRDAKRASIEALRELIQEYDWTYLYGTGRVHLQPMYSTGLVTYAGAGNLCANQVSLTGGTWPAWANLGVLRIGLINHDVIARINGTTLQLDPGESPPFDIAAPSAFGLFLDSYSLPSDFAAMDKIFVPLEWGEIHYCHPRDWLFEISRWGTIGTPVAYTIMADADLGGRLALNFAPLPTIAHPVEFLYKRHANPLKTFRSSSGTVATAASSKTIVGTGTAFNAAMAGNCLLRISGTSKPPTAAFGDNQPAFESKITTCTSPTQLTTWDAVPVTLAGAPYTISSWIDIETGAMEDAYLRCCEKHISQSRIMKDKPSARNQYLEALEVAKCADARNKMRKRAGVNAGYRRRLKDFPINLHLES